MSPYRLVSRRMTIRAGVAVVLVQSLLPCQALAAEAPLSYFCAKYGAVFQYFSREALKDYGEVHATDVSNPIASVSNSISDIRDCSTTELYCLTETLRTYPPNIDTFTYAVPRRLVVGQSYDVGNFHFRSDYAPSMVDGSPAAVIFVNQKRTQREDVRYKFFVEQGRGITQLYFDSLHGADSAYFEFTDVTCNIIGMKGLFPGVEITVPQRPTIVQ